MTFHGRGGIARERRIRASLPAVLGRLGEVARLAAPQCAYEIPSPTVFSKAGSEATATHIYICGRASHPVRRAKNLRFNLCFSLHPPPPVLGKSKVGGRNAGTASRYINILPVC